MGSDTTDRAGGIGNGGYWQLCHGPAYANEAGDTSSSSQLNRANCSTLTVSFTKKDMTDPVF